MNAITRWRHHKGYSIADAAQLLDTSIEVYDLIERGVARQNLPAVRTLENELHKPYSTLKKELQ